MLFVVRINVFIAWIQEVLIIKRLMENNKIIHLSLL